MSLVSALVQRKSTLDIISSGKDGLLLLWESTLGCASDKIENLKRNDPFAFLDEWSDESSLEDGDEENRGVLRIIIHYFFL